MTVHEGVQMTIEQDASEQSREGTGHVDSAVSLLSWMRSHKAEGDSITDFLRS
jgi:hypothetical protein